MYHRLQATGDGQWDYHHDDMLPSFSAYASLNTYAICNCHSSPTNDIWEECIPLLDLNAFWEKIRPLRSISRVSCATQS